MVSDDENELLTQAFRQLSRCAGLVARHQRKNIGEVEITVGLPTDHAHALVRRVLASQGRLLTSGGYERVVIGAGAWILSPAVVTVRLNAPPAEAALDIRTAITVRGVACEGLIKQRGGEVAAQRIADMIRGAARSR